MPAPRPAPVAPRRAHPLQAHGTERDDPWFWLNDRSDRAVLEHLRAENAHTSATLAHLEPLRVLLFDEIAARIAQTDTAAAHPDGPWEYYTRTVEGLDHALLCRRPRGGGDEQIMLDPNDEAAGHDYYELGTVAVSPDHRTLAFAVDTTGSERYTLNFVDLASGAPAGAPLPDVYYGLAFGQDSRSILAVRPDATMRPFAVIRHTIGEPPDDASTVLIESDDRFYVTLRRARSGEFAIVQSDSKTTSEAWLLDTADLEQPAVSVLGRRDGVEYSVDHQRGAGGGRVLAVTNDLGADFRLVTVAVRDLASRPIVEELLGHRPGVRVVDVDAFDGFAVVTERSDAQERLRLVDEHGDRLIGPSEDLGTLHVGRNREPHATAVRIEYSSLIRPWTSADLDIATDSERLLKIDPVLDGYEPGDFMSERIWASSPDATAIPITVVRPRGDRDGPAPMVLYAYGAYETSIMGSFSHTRVSLLRRGVAFAIAHVRGGGEMGRAWYDAGKLARKRNTFIDFVACAAHLIGLGHTSPERLVARGRSAGGLTMGAIANMAPQLFCAIVAEVPFVDVLTTMQDPTLPLTITEWDEWGNPTADAELYECMAAYSPYDNVVAQSYPAILATAGLNDSRVQYWEPAKWVQRLRERSTSDAPVLLHCELDAGHGGPSGRSAAWRDEAFVLAFILDRLGVAP